MSVEAMKMALEALEHIHRTGDTQVFDLCYAKEVIPALRAALDAPEPEPVAWELRKGKTDRVLLEITNNAKRAHDWKCSLEEIVPLYTRPQPAAWVGLTDEDKHHLNDALNLQGRFPVIDAIEAKLKAKNT